MSVTFNIDMFISDFQTRLQQSLSSYMNTVLDIMKDNVNGRKWENEVRNALSTNVVFTDDNIILKIGLLKNQDDEDPILWKAMILNYGSGEYADFADNEFGNDYVLSEFYNNSRYNNVILSRPNSAYFDVEKGVFVDSTASSVYELPKEFGMPPSLFFDLTVLEYFNEEIVCDFIEDVFHGMDFGRYIEFNYSFK